VTALEWAWVIGFCLSVSTVTTAIIASLAGDFERKRK
jgi:hypothetical protein